ncbi:MAG: hypothetical protein KC777_08090 [Cyanobacteria bacterium HKST-UBA02]|nr:hypothetical protein [Cyanobacteria bacterium HKST-UBA02]
MAHRIGTYFLALVIAGAAGAPQVWAGDGPNDWDGEVGKCLAVSPYQYVNGCPAVVTVAIEVPSQKKQEDWSSWAGALASSLRSSIERDIECPLVKQDEVRKTSLLFKVTDDGKIKQIERSGNTEFDNFLCKKVRNMEGYPILKFPRTSVKQVLLKASFMQASTLTPPPAFTPKDNPLRKTRD